MLKLSLNIFLFLAAILFFTCGDDSTTNNNGGTPVDSNVVLRVDSVVLNTSTSFFVQQTFTFSKKLKNIDFQYWGESNIPPANGPFIKLVFKSDFGDSNTFIQTGGSLDSIPRDISNTLSFNFGDSCKFVKTQLSMNDSITPPISPDKYIKIRNLKVYSY